MKTGLFRRLLKLFICMGGDERMIPAINASSFPRKRESSASDSEHIRPTTFLIEAPLFICAADAAQLDSRFRGNDENFVRRVSF
jgi:hypothetical protein